MDSSGIPRVGCRRPDMGVSGMFAYKGRTYRLEFTEGPLSGLVIQCRPMSLGEVAAVIEAHEPITGGVVGLRDFILGSDADGFLYQHFMPAIESVNVDGDHEELFRSMDIADITRILVAWIEAISGGGTPLTDVEMIQQEEELGLDEM